MNSCSEQRVFIILNGAVIAFITAKAGERGYAALYCLTIQYLAPKHEFHQPFCKG